MPTAKKHVILKDKKGNRYVLVKGKRVLVHADVTDHDFLKWLIQFLKPKRKKRVKSKPVVNSGPSAPDLEIEHVRAYINEERREGKVPYTAPPYPGGPAMFEHPAIQAAPEPLLAIEPPELPAAPAPAPRTPKREGKDQKQTPKREGKQEKKAPKKQSTLLGRTIEHSPEFEADIEHVRGAIPKAEITEVMRPYYVHQLRDMVREYEPGTVGYVVSFNKHPVLGNTWRQEDYISHLYQHNHPEITSKVEEAIQKSRAKEAEKIAATSAAAAAPTPAKKPFSAASPSAAKRPAKKIGSGAESEGKGLLSTQIDDIMSSYRPHYLGTIARDEWKLLTPPSATGKSAWIMNTDRSTQPGKHWVAFLIDLDRHSVEYYNSFADDIPSDVLISLKDFIATHNVSKHYLKLKVNHVIDQDANSDNCGWFCCKFIINRFRGRPWRECTKFDEHVKGEEAIAEFTKKYGDYSYL